MNTQTPLSFAILSDFSLHTDADGLLQILPYGQFRARDGRPFDAPYWNLDDASGERLAAQLNTRLKDLVVDYEHQTLNAQKNGLPAPASGWLKARHYVYKPGQGLFARVEWTSKAQSFIDNNEYRYLSPVFAYDKNGEIYQFLHLALTNTPALDNLPEIVAALSQSFTFMEQKTMNEALKLLKQLLGLPESADESQTVAALNTVTNLMTSSKGLATCNTNLIQFMKDNQAHIVALSTAESIQVEPDPAKYVPIDVVKSMQTELAALSNKVKEFEGKQSDELIQAALSDGRLLPSLKSWAEGLAKTNIVALTEYLGSAQPVAALSQTQTNGLPPAGLDNKKGALTQEQIAVCSELNITPEEYLKTLETK
ncbi:phage protease [Neisseria sp. Ec49-e6-T10]|uniref:phage protease n=1 Tax=Neisseria sp. Ec49-e6-T10 TaxID=3140744 RepID=UPI003EB70FB5